MIHGSTTLPRWAVVGLAVVAAFTVLAAAAFIAGTRLFPESKRERTRMGERRRRAEIRAYLRRIGEEFVEDHPVADRTVAFYLPERDVAITFDVHAFFRIDETGTHAVLVEHELPGPLLGARLPFETPDPEPAFGEDPRPGDRGLASAFAVLDLPPDADEGAVRAAYREKVLTVHPDQGGDPEAFQRLQEAYTAALAAAGEGEANRSRPPGRSR